MICDYCGSGVKIRFFKRNHRFDEGVKAPACIGGRGVQVTPHGRCEDKHPAIILKVIDN